MEETKKVTLVPVHYKKIMIGVLVGAIIWFWPWAPAAVNPVGWHVLAIFVAMIVTVVIQGMSIGAASLVGLTASVVLGVFDIKTALSAFGSSTAWLVAMAFFLSQAILKTGLGLRLAYIMISKIGKSTTNIAYALAVVDLILAPATPSNTARSGGIVYSIAQSVMNTFDSYPNDSSSKRIGEYLTMSVFQVMVVTSAMFLTAVAQNPMCQELAKAAGVDISWGYYALAMIVPGVLSIIAIPIVLRWLLKPELYHTPEAPAWAQDQLNQLGPMSQPEKRMAWVFVIALLGWVFGPLIGIDATAMVFIVASLMLLLGILSFDDMKGNKGAWDTLMWFSVFIFLATQLNETGFIPWLGEIISGSIAGMPWGIVMIVLLLAYHYSHYIFASTSAHAGAMFSIFLTVAIGAGAPPLYAAIMLIAATSLCTATTHYSNGAAPLLFGAGYVDQGTWWKTNFLMSFVYFVMFYGVGTLWLKLIGAM